MQTTRTEHSNSIASVLVSGDPRFADLAAQFVSSLRYRLEDMDSALQSADFERLRNAAHRLKGSAGSYGYPLLSERAAEMERHAGAETPDDCVAAFARLREVCTRIVVA